MGSSLPDVDVKDEVGFVRFLLGRWRTGQASISVVVNGFRVFGRFMRLSHHF